MCQLNPGDESFRAASNAVQLLAILRGLIAIAKTVVDSRGCKRASGSVEAGC